MPLTREQLQQTVQAISIPEPEQLATFVKQFASPQDLLNVQVFLTAAQNVQASAGFREMRRRALEKHCMRCHGTYTEDEKSLMACEIPHVFSSDGRWTRDVSNGEKVYVYDAECCNDLALEDKGVEHVLLGISQLGLCFEGRHTDRVEDVAAHYNGMDLLPCAWDGTGACTRRRLHPVEILFDYRG